MGHERYQHEDPFSYSRCDSLEEGRMKDETILCIAPRAWDSLWRESQQIMSRMAKQNRVLYFEPGRDVREPLLKAFGRNMRHFLTMRTRPIRENLILIPCPSRIPIGRRHLPSALLKITTPLVVKINSKILIRHIRKAMKALRVEKPILWLYSPYHAELVGKFDEKISCYHNYDEFSDFIYNNRIKEILQKYDDELSSSVDIIFATSQSQASRRKQLNPNTYFIPNGVHFELFNRALKDPSHPPSDIVSLPHPTIGFVGWMGYLIDTELLIQISKAFPDHSLVLIGPNDLPRGRKKQDLESLPNVFFLGKKEPPELPDYLQCIDVAIMPYLNAGHIRSAYPLKLHEYLAAGRAVVAIEMPELLPYQDVIRIAKDSDTFIQQIHASINDYSPDIVQARVETARQNTWEERVERMYQAMETTLTKSRQLETQSHSSAIHAEQISHGQDLSLPLVSVVIVTWNRKADVLETIQSILEQSYRNIEVVVVDNASTDGTVEALKQVHPEIEVIPLEQNIGASAGRNPGITAAKGEIVFLLDSDASLGKDTIRNAVQKFQSRPDIGVIACKVVNASTKEIDRMAGWIFSEKDKVDQDLEFLSFSFSECGCAIRKEVFSKAGLFWDALFIDGEGEELGLRIWDAGYAILYSPESMIYHRVSPNGRVAGCNRYYYKLRNMLYIYIVRYPWWMLPIYIPTKIAVSLIRASRRKCLKVIVQAILDVLKKIPYLLKERRPITTRTGRTYFRLQREHGPWRWDLISWFKYKT
jgi:GT2 family glycosyltransferase